MMYNECRVHVAWFSLDMAGARDFTWCVTIPRSWALQMPTSKFAVEPSSRWATKARQARQDMALSISVELTRIPKTDPIFGAREKASQHRTQWWASELKSSWTQFVLPFNVLVFSGWGQCLWCLHFTSWVTCERLSMTQQRSFVVRKRITFLEALDSDGRRVMIKLIWAALCL